MQHSYHNSVDEPLQLAICYEQKAKDQETEVLKYFNIYWDNALNPSHIHDHLIELRIIGSNTPLTSIRRAITNLTARGLLRKTCKKVTGKYGRQEYLWERV